MQCRRVKKDVAEKCVRSEGGGFGIFSFQVHATASQVTFLRSVKLFTAYLLIFKMIIRSRCPDAQTTKIGFEITHRWASRLRRTACPDRHSGEMTGQIISKPCHDCQTPQLKDVAVLEALFQVEAWKER